MTTTKDTASIDLAQLDSLQNYYSPHGTLVRLADVKCVFMELARRSLTSGAPADGYVLVPKKITPEMIEAGIEAHYGKRRVAQVGGAAGVSMTVNNTDYNGVQAMRNFWKGALSAAPVHDAAAPGQMNPSNSSSSCGAAGPSAPIVPPGVAKLLLRLREDAVLSEGQITKALGVDRLTCREILDGSYAGAAAKSEQALADVQAHFLAVQDQCEHYRNMCINLRAQLSGAAGAGSAQPRAAKTEQAPNWQARRWCTGDAEWTDWADISNAKYDQWQGDRSFEFRHAQSATTASASNASLREAVRAITLLIQNREWADVLDMDADAAALWDAVDDVISDRAALARAPLPAQVKSDDEHMQRQRKIVKFGDKALINAVRTGQISIHKAIEKIDAANAGKGVQPVDDARDAARYCWLRNPKRTHAHVGNIGDNTGKAAYLTEFSLDRAIDAAMRANDSAAEGGNRG